MLVKIKSISMNENQCIVEFTSKYGDGYGVWHGIPQIGKEYEVEIEITNSLRWGTDIKITNERMEMISKEYQLLKLNGELQHVYDDQLAVLKIGSSMIFLETEGNAFPEGSSIQIKVPLIHIYDTNI
ncbi:hypothetical protein [Laceyella putida]|uniref:Uncharacterized protein n=1 Tax=Laceyella putida TaxID=110101 RepID=A0ABW2RPT9_9BACL